MLAAVVTVPAVCLLASAAVAVVAHRRARALVRAEAQMRRYAATEAPERGRRVGVLDFADPVLAGLRARMGRRFKRPAS